MMSVAKVMKNVYTFTQILGQASNEEAALWDTLALENSLKWAAYCEQLHRHVKGKPIEADFERQLQEMTLLLEPPLCLSVNLSLLENATQILQNILLCNPHVNRELLNGLILSIQLYNPNEEDFVKRFSKLACLQGAVDISEAILKEISPSADHFVRQEVCTAAEGSLYSAAIVLIHHLERQLNNVSNVEKFTHYVEKLAESLIIKNTGWEILVCSLCVESDDHLERTELEYQKTKDIILQWMEKVCETSSHSRNLCDVSSLLLAKVSAENSQFYQFYRNILVEWGAMMVPDYSRQEDNSCKLYGWKPNRKSSVGSFSSLVDHFVMLFDHAQPQSLRVSLGEFLSELAMKSYFNIWRDVIKAVQETLNRKQKKLTYS